MFSFLLKHNLLADGVGKSKDNHMNYRQLFEFKFMLHHEVCLFNLGEITDTLSHWMELWWNGNLSFNINFLYYGVLIKVLIKCFYS